MSNDRRWTDEHGADGLRRKFDVYKPRDGAARKKGTVYMPESRIGADGEFIFVLRPETDQAAVEALNVYALHCEERAPVLANDIRHELLRITRRNRP